MRFGPVPLSEAEGGLLAYALRVPGGLLKKGHVLTADDLAALAAAGIAEVTVARLDPGDVGENAAALRLAEALVGDGQAAGLRLDPAFTGRVNIRATGAGIVALDAAAISRLNAVDPMITLATVPEWQRVTEGTMVGTVKIISYAVPEAALEAACAAGRGALRRLPPVISAAELIVTQVPGAPARRDDKGIAAVEGRLAALGVALAGVEIVDHEAGAVAAALVRHRSGLSLILTASATSDAHDVAPEGMVRAGGRLIRFGMPVDPGNLLFLGEIGGRPVIGLPGCARSPALNGADWVLERVVCGVEVSHEDIAAMGVGGLLKEIPTRPQPRDGPRRAPGAPD
ncbi:molybdopterin-binding protein [Roseibacterium sp. SDUM158016]|uniref:molybdopterin-binding protein n=1 Tax=Roseicyclus sediminis TaxID=2980997 RepID=UPI0021D29A8F|nr:molybdopterin-binding protein [Roseibacterium sp. SDUM158016]MCU4654724.1 molybdopterin-binding protein [Roseibacterium sp. SDUM158016]